MSHPTSHPYTDGLDAGVVRYQCCGDCGSWQPLERHACRACGSLQLQWRDAGGLATVYAVTEISRAPAEAFRALAPYTLVLATLDEGPRVMGHAEPGVAIGDRVRAGFLRFGEGTLLRFLRE
ncbi:Zn-ribbon domain-containing OB-fold protein [Cupriavidus consociatus]|uniref:Zn-ribbon domain-containing OB-fold protein n=1 Tax=Cupriavidus consociatus TaxID=2821357 RepID=UPI001AEAB371|nr:MULTISPECIES: OB-fold domain-containing protein [unclassified Cupriavidus]MBP0620544.1 OB-fold domain-containing protein [Cupriavidus sp. LEh25]MDK2657204.1 OB-fold domain-containing protein [Cupriavidus sp. LEh21]